MSTVGSYGNLNNDKYAFHDDFIQIEPIGNRTDYVRLARAFKQVVLNQPTDSVAETTNEFKVDNFELHMVCGFANWKGANRDHCKRIYIK